jgi:LPS sulfotransferase NodH
MEVTEIFQSIQENQFLQKLSFREKILFIGEEETTSYLNNYFDSCHQNQGKSYCNWEEKFEEELFLAPQQLITYQAVIVASTKNEQIIFEIVSNQIASLNLNVPVLRLFTDLFVNFMSGQKLLQTSDYEIRLPKISYAIVTTPRSGSNFLCSILNSTNIAGYPKEHLRQASLDLAKHCHFDYIRLLQILMTYQVTPNGVFGTKFISHFLKDFQQTKFEFDRIFKSISKYIYLVRRDKIAQAVSIIIAQKTNVWHIDHQNQQFNYQAKLQTINIDENLLNRVHHVYKSLQRGEISLTKLFENYRISPLLIEYEELLENKEEQLQKILDYLEINYSKEQIINSKSSFQKTSSNLSQQIINRYKEKYLSI